MARKFSGDLVWLITCRKCLMDLQLVDANSFWGKASLSARSLFLHSHLPFNLSLDRESTFVG